MTTDGDNGLREDAHLPKTQMRRTEETEHDAVTEHTDGGSAARAPVEGQAHLCSAIMVLHRRSGRNWEELGGGTKGIKDETVGGEHVKVDFCLVSSAEDTSLAVRQVLPMNVLNMKRPRPSTLE